MLAVVPMPEDACPPPEPPRPAAPDLFGYAAAPLGPRAVPAAWSRVAAPDAALTGLHGPWDALLAQAAGSTETDLFDRVNRWVNLHVRYRDDTAGDDWALPIDTLLNGYGDCEDLAILKRALLAELGIPDESMYLVLARDSWRGIDHAVLAVRGQSGFWVLDNRRDDLVRADAGSAYLPTFGYSGGFAWIYGKRQVLRVEAVGSGARGAGHGQGGSSVGRR